MSVNIKKAAKPVKIASKPAVEEEVSLAKTLQDNYAKELSELAQLQTKVAAAKAELAPLEKRIKEIQSLMADNVDANAPPNEGVDLVAQTDHGEIIVKIGARATKRDITDKEGLFNALEEVQEGLVFDLASITFSDLDKYLSQVEQGKYIQTTQSGARRVTAKVG